MVPINTVQELYALFPGTSQGSICFENEYDGKAKGTVSHTDNSEINASRLMRCYLVKMNRRRHHITLLDETIRLQQGEMLIHLGDLELADADIGSGVRMLLVAFLACEWKDEELNKPILEMLATRELQLIFQ